MSPAKPHLHDRSDNVTRDMLWSKRGTSIAEFLICAPVLVMLSLGAYDLNRRMEDQQTATIMARNLVTRGDGAHQDHLDSAVKQDFKATARILDQSEQSQLAQLSSGDAPGLKNTVTEDQQQAGGTNDRLTVASGVKSSTPSFDMISTAFGSVASATVPVFNQLESVGVQLGVILDDSLRQASIETSATGDANALQRSLALVTQMATRDDRNGESVLGLKRRYASSFYLRGDSGYHPSDSTRLQFVGAALGLAAGGSWSSDDTFADRSSGFQSRCMTRLAGSSQCDNPSAAKAMLEDREFLKDIHGIATVKFLLATIAKVIPGVNVAAEAGEEAASVVVDQVTSDLTEALVGAAVDRIEAQVGADLGKKVDDFVTSQESAMTDQLTKLDQGADPSGLAGTIGGGA